MSSKIQPLCGRLMLVAMAAMLSLGGCSSDPKAPTAPKTCEPGETLLDDGRCQPAGLPLDMQCQPGELALENGGCQPAGLPPDMVCPPGEYEKEGGGCEPAGIPPEMCAPGFVPDGNRGCEPILPADPCPDGLMAIPGETVCREVMPCGVGDYGDIPVDATTQYVNAAYAGNDSNGTKAKPWKTIQAGVNAATNGAIVAVAAGTYNEDVVISGKPAKLWGRCPGMVELKGQGALTQALQVYGAKASDTEVHGLSITGPMKGIEITNTTDVLVNRVRIHDAGYVGIDTIKGNYPTALAITDSLIEKATNLGVQLWGAEGVVERSVVRATRDDGSGNWGRGIHANNLDTNRATLELRDSVIDSNRHYGVSVFGSDALVDSTIVKNTKANNLASAPAGILAIVKGGLRSTVTTNGAFVTQNEGAGIAVVSSDAIIDNTTVSDTMPVGNSAGGRGIDVSNNPGSADRSNVVVAHSLITRNQEAGISVFAANIGIDASIIANTLAVANFDNGFGVITKARKHQGSRLTMRGSIVENNANTNAQIESTEATIESTILRNGASFGLAAIYDLDNPAVANVSVRDSLIEKNRAVGVSWDGAEGKIESSEVRDTTLGGAENFGLGVVATARDTSPANLEMRGVLVEHCHGAGVFVVGSRVLIDGAVIRATLNFGDETGGGGLYAQGSESTFAPADVTVIRTRITENAQFGLFASGASLTMDASDVRENGLQSIKPGSGIQLESWDEVAQRTRAMIHASIIGSNQGGGLVVLGADAEIVGTLIQKNTMVSGLFGRGLVAQVSKTTGTEAHLSAKGSVIEDNDEIGIFIGNATANIVSTVVRGTKPNLSSKFGDGLLVVSSPEFVEKFGLSPPFVTIDQCRFENNARAGVANFSGNIVLTNSELVCHAFDLNGEDEAGYAWSFDGSQNNNCGCPEATGTCGAKSAGLEAPNPTIDLVGHVPSP